MYKEEMNRKTYRRKSGDDQPVIRLPRGLEYPVNCSVCGMKADGDDVVTPSLEANSKLALRVCELCACDIAMALFSQRTVTVKLDDGMLMMEVL